MPLVLFVAFLVVPLVELIVVLRVGELIGVWPTVLLLVLDSLVGAYLVRREGRRAWAAFRAALAELRWPGDEVAQGALVLVGGALLLTPGFVTDAAGLLMVLPPTRAALSRLLRRRLGPPRPGTPAGPVPRPPGGGRVVDVEVVSVERDDDPTS